MSTENDESTADDTRTQPEGAGEERANPSLAAASPEAIAKRVAALGDDDALEQFAREEERKLAERRASEKRGKRTALEAAASKKLAGIGVRAEPRRSVATVADADPLLQQTAKLSKWFAKNQRTVQALGALVFVGLCGYAIYNYVDHKRSSDASALLAEAVTTGEARIGAARAGESMESTVDESPSFNAPHDRREAALKKYREVIVRFPKSGAAYLARLAEGSLLLDAREADAAAAAFSEVEASPLAAVDQEVKGRAIEGLGFAFELKASANPSDSAQYWEQAAKAYKRLESNDEILGFRELAIYHQARMAQARGDKEKAKELLVDVRERVGKTPENISGIPQGPAFVYLAEVAQDRLRALDPTMAPASGGVPGGGGGKITSEQIRRMMEQSTRKAAAHHGDGNDHAP